MTPRDVFNLIPDLQARETPFAVATVVRTLSVTSAKAGAKALILGDGTVVAGWIGGGCARGATLTAVRDSLADGWPRLISVQPEEMLEEIGVHAGDTRDGVHYARNKCPSQGTLYIFVEPVLPRPELVVLGTSPVASALVGLAGKFGFRVTAAAPAKYHGDFAGADQVIDGFALPAPAGPRYVVVSTQSTGDLTALKAAITGESAYVAFVGSRRKIASLIEDLRGEGVPEERLAAVKAPAGLDIGAITPEEIALSILAEIVSHRRKGAKPAPE
ncbi:XdhC family protein [Zavarzinia sp.]|uniref:XdhC family protein n=1 Tax=Zavarzinia sp. TaxID=2027920 RepID=UPI00356373E3